MAIGSMLASASAACSTARRGALFLDDRSGAPRNVLALSDPGEAAYAARFHSLNPYVARAARDFADARLRHVGTAKIGAELVADETFLRSEYYFDFARRYERRHMVGGVLGTSQVVPIGFFRGDDADPFDEREVRLLRSLMPHVQRALELRARLSREDETVSPRRRPASKKSKPSAHRAARERRQVSPPQAVTARKSKTTSI
jgi:hypothetical protein